MDETELEIAFQNIKAALRLNTTQSLKTACNELVVVGFEYFFKRKQYHKALEQFEAGLSYAEKSKDSVEVVYCLRFVTVALIELKKFKRARQMLARSFGLCHENFEAMQFEALNAYINSAHCDFLEYEQCSAKIKAEGLIHSSLSSLFIAEKLADTILVRGCDKGSPLEKETRLHSCTIFRNQLACYDALCQPERALLSLEKLCTQLHEMGLREQLSEVAQDAIIRCKALKSIEERICRFNSWLGTSTDDDQIAFICFIEIATAHLSQNIPDAISAFKKACFHFEKMSSGFFTALNDIQKISRKIYHLDILVQLQNSGMSLIQLDKMKKAAICADYSLLSSYVDDFLEVAQDSENSQVLRVLLDSLICVDSARCLKLNKEFLKTELSSFELAMIYTRISQCKIDLYEDHDDVEMSIQQGIAYCQRSKSLLLFGQMLWFAFSFYNSTGDTEMAKEFRNRIHFLKTDPAPIHSIDVVLDTTIDEEEETEEISPVSKRLKSSSLVPQKNDFTETNGITDGIQVFCKVLGTKFLILCSRNQLNTSFQWLKSVVVDRFFKRMKYVISIEEVLVDGCIVSDDDSIIDFETLNTLNVKMNVGANKKKHALQVYLEEIASTEMVCARVYLFIKLVL